MDILVRLKDFWVNIVAGLPPCLASYILRMGLLLVMTGVFLMLSWRYLPFRSTFSQVLVTLATITIALHLPVQSFLKIGKGGLAFSITLAFLCLVFIPNFIPFFLTPKLGNQVRIRKTIVVIVWGLFILQLIMR